MPRGRWQWRSATWQCVAILQQGGKWCSGMWQWARWQSRATLPRSWLEFATGTCRIIKGLGHCHGEWQGFSLLFLVKKNII